MKPIAILVLLSALVGCKSREPAAHPPGPSDSSISATPSATSTSAPVAISSVDPSTPTASIDGARFAFADSTGSLLVWDGTDSLMEGPYFLATLEGEPAPLKDMGHQRADAGWDGRQTARNFAKVGGHLFRVADQVVEPNRTYLVVTKQFLSNHTPIAVTSEICSEMDSLEASMVPHPQNRRIIKAWSLASLDGRSLNAVLFDGRPPLAALVVADWDSAISERFVGEPNDDSSSVWRVDDGGVFNGCGLAIVAAFKSNGRLEIARTWAAFEGENEVFLQESADTFAVAKYDNRYWSP